MKRTLLGTIALIVALLAALGWWIAGPPPFTRSAPIPPTFVTWLKGEHPTALAERLQDPLEVSLRLLYFGAGDPIDTQGMNLRVRADDHGDRIVTIDDRHVEDDSISRTYHQVRLRRDGLTWIPTEHRMARQGRGVFGWTTGATK